MYIILVFYNFFLQMRSIFSVKLIHCEEIEFSLKYIICIELYLQKQTFHMEKRVGNSTPLRVSSQPLILLRRLWRVLRMCTYTHLCSCMHSLTQRAQARLETRASKGNRSTTLNDSDDNLPAPHLTPFIYRRSQ